MTIEGLVKYTLTHKKGLLPPALVFDTPRVQELDRMRTEFVDRGFVGADKEGIGFGNVSCRIRKQGYFPDAFLISGTSTGKSRILGLQGYALITKACIINNSIESQGPVPPSSEALSHAAIYATCPHVNFVVHGHHAEVFAFGLTYKTPSTEADILYGTPDMAQAITRIVEGLTKGFFITQGHQDGFFSFGSEVASIFLFRNSP